MTQLSQEEVSRYARHLILPEVGVKGQEKLKNSSVLLVGAGGLGSPVALYLAAAGVGHLGVVDFDVVDESNLQRQIIHGTSTVGQLKLESAKKRLKDLNPHVKITGIPERLSSKNALDIFKDYDVIADGTDNFPTRYLVNDACVLAGKVNVYASIFRFEGQLSVFNAEGGPCYRCVYPEPPPPGLVPSCAEGGVMGVLPGVIGCLQATEVIKVLLNIGKAAVGRLVLYDALQLKFRELKCRKDPNCPVCGENPSITELIDYEQFCGIPKTPKKESVPSITVQDFAEQKKANHDLVLVDVREPYEIDICEIEGSIKIPLSQLAKQSNHLDKDKNMVIHCKMGGRSAKGVKLLLEKGFKNVQNLEGGIIAWAEKIDQNLKRY